jgi:predicted nucleic acid-binding Zn ribbon protein
VEVDKIIEEIEKSEKRFKLAMVVFLCIVSLAAVMIFISLISVL